MLLDTCSIEAVKVHYSERLLARGNVCTVVEVPNVVVAKVGVNDGVFCAGEVRLRVEEVQSILQSRHDGRVMLDNIVGRERFVRPVEVALADGGGDELGEDFSLLL
jgi:hypothetical protein